MSEFTQDNWELDEVDGHVILAGGRVIAGTYAPITTEQGIAEMRANARLVAAAPEMYATLKKMLSVPGFVYGLGFDFCRHVEKLLAWIDGNEETKNDYDA